MKEKNPSMVAIWWSLVSNMFLTLGKIIIGFLFHSQVLIADGIHNAGDVAATFATLSSMKISKQPADEDHPYGHGKAEVVAAGVVAMILLMASLFMVYHSLTSFFSSPQQVGFAALWVALFSLCLKYGLYRYTLIVALKEKSKGLEATAYDHLADVYASFAAVFGIGVSIIGHNVGVSYFSYGDAIAGVIVAYMVLKLGWDMGKESVSILMEENVVPEKMDRYIQMVSSISEVKRIDRLRAREHGHYILVDVRVSIDATLTIQEGHDISKKIKQQMMKEDEDIHEVLIHLNPYYEEEPLTM